MWARWHWPDGVGRWHVIADSAAGTYTLACGRVRSAPIQTGSRPSNDNCCPTCPQLGDLGQTYRPETADQPRELAPA